jgi:hypothetical protein
MMMQESKTPFLLKIPMGKWNNFSENYALSKSFDNPDLDIMSTAQH